MGDLLVGLASLVETLEKWPDSKLTVVGSALWTQIIEPGFFPQVDRIAVIEKRADDVRVFEIHDGKWAEVGRSTLKTQYQDCRIVFNTRVDSPRQGFPAFFAGVAERWGSAKGLAGFIYNCRARHNGKDPLIHERDVPLLVMDEAEGRVKSKGLSLSEALALSPRVKRWQAKGLPAPLRLKQVVATAVAGATVGAYVLVNPTSSRREKAWPSSRFRELILGLESNVHAEILVLGSPQETDWLREVATGGPREREFRIVQPRSIGDLFQVVAGARWLLTNTSSVQFIAAAVQTPVVTLMGRATPEIWGPLGPKDKIVRGVEPREIEDMFIREQRAYESIEVREVRESLLSLDVSTQASEWGSQKW
ncbi:MAG: glycosyltransferase family 9 protein [Bdellovibrionales bacterium]|nr:glycosyltransferase family 9 protein [Bdellovibrionales bacterium]